jgi:hypothetical protein
MPHVAATPDGMHKLSVAANTHRATSDEERMAHKGRREGREQEQRLDTPENKGAEANMSTRSHCHQHTRQWHAAGRRSGTLD